MVLAFRRAGSPYRTVEASLRGLDSDGAYDLEFDPPARPARERGSVLMRDYPLTLAGRRSSMLIRYRSVSE
jgi:hypothetical protein